MFQSKAVEFYFQKGRTKVTCLASLWKILITFIGVIFTFSIRSSDNVEGLFALFNDGTSLISSFNENIFLGRNELCNHLTPFLLAVCNILCSYLCYKASKSVCVIFCQRFGFGLPMLVLPFSITGTLLGLMYYPSLLKFKSCDLMFHDWCIKDGSYIVEKNRNFFGSFFAFFVSVFLITRHVWRSNGYRHGETAR